MNPLGNRHEARLRAVQFLFQRDFNKGDLDDDLALYWEGDPAENKTVRKFADLLINGVLANLETIDERILKYAENWTLERMNAVDRNVMRLAVFEMLYRDDIPPVVSIHEAITLAKGLSSIESGRFVNGILDRLLKSIDRSPRDSGKKKG